MKTLLPIELITLLKPISLEQLMEVKVKVNNLIEKKTIQPITSKAIFSGSFQTFTKVSIPDKDIDILFSLVEKRTEENTLQAVINLVDEWMSDESGYDEENYSQIESGLKENRLSI